MSTRETSEPIASVAGRILAAGNPLYNAQVIAAIYAGLQKAIHDSPTADLSPVAIQAALKPVLDPYFDNMLSLAGSCLSQTEEDDSQPPRVSITATVDWEKITNAIIGAFEGGSTYWLRKADYVYQPDGVSGSPLYAQNDFWAKGGKMQLIYDNPEEPGDEEPLCKEVGLIEIRKGLRSMAEKSYRHFDDLIAENDDAITHDVFIQHVLFGEVIYG
jgi:hypothetical protein